MVSLWGVGGRAEFVGTDFVRLPTLNIFTQKCAQHLLLLFDDFGVVLHGSKERQPPQMPV